jgi:hypothetical protein
MSLQKGIRFLMRGEQALELGAQVGVARVGLIEERGALLGWTLKGGEEERVQAGVSLGVHRVPVSQSLV